MDVEGVGGDAIMMQATYTYDALDRRIATEVDLDGDGLGAAETTWTVYDGPNPYADVDGSGNFDTRYLHGLAIDELLARTDSAEDTSWYLPDRLGTIRDIVDDTGASLYHAAYDGFGQITSQSGGSGDRFGFTAREHDEGTNLRAHRHRYADPETGRWTQEDPIGFAGGDANFYRYVGNGPGNSADALGLFPNPFDWYQDNIHKPMHDWWFDRWNGGAGLGINLGANWTVTPGFGYPGWSFVGGVQLIWNPVSAGDRWWIPYPYYYGGSGPAWSLLPGLGVGGQAGIVFIPDESFPISTGMFDPGDYTGGFVGGGVSLPVAPPVGGYIAGDLGWEQKRLTGVNAVGLGVQVSSSGSPASSSITFPEASFYGQIAP